jgi:hypothetical protein
MLQQPDWQVPPVLDTNCCSAQGQLLKQLPKKPPKQLPADAHVPDLIDAISTLFAQ